MGRGRGGLWLTRPFRRPAVKLFQRLSAKFMVGVGGILAIALALSIFVNTQVVERYYLRRQTGYVEAAGQRLEALIGRGMNPGTGEAALEGRRLELTRTEFGLLSCFMSNQRMVLSRERLLDRVWGMDFTGDARTVDAHIRRLRGKIGGGYIKTRIGMGYVMEDVDG